MTATPFYNRGGEHNEGKRTFAYYPKIDDKYCFLDAMASLESMLESERVMFFKILSNLGHIFRVCSVFYGKHCQRHNSL